MVSSIVSSRSREGFRRPSDREDIDYRVRGQLGLHRGRALYRRTPDQAALLAPEAGASRRTPSSICRALSRAPAIPLPPSRPPARMPWLSFFPLPSVAEGRSLVVSGGSSVGKRPYAHQQNENAKHTSCQWRLMAMSLLTW